MTSSTVISAGIMPHGGQHFADSGFEADEYGAADNAVADIQFGEMRDRLEQPNVLVIQSVAGVDFQAQFSSLGGGFDQLFQFRLVLTGWKRFRKGPGVQLDEL